MSQTQDAGSPRPPLVLPALGVGLGASVLMWGAWYVLHMPGVDASQRISAAVIGSLLFLGVAFGVAMGGRSGRPGWLVGLLSGLVSAILNQTLLLMHVVEQPESTEQMGEAANRLSPSAPGVIIGFVLACVVVGAIAGGVGGALARRGKRSDSQAWLGRLGIVAACSILPLLAAGGAVTSTESGMAVPDPVTSYGAVSFLFPLSLMGESRIFFEHSHRLLGTMVGMISVVWAIATTIVDRRLWMRAAIWIYGLVIAAQAVAGAVRVGEDLQWMALLHGVVGQLTFMLAIWLAAAQRPRYIEGPSLVGDETRAASRRARMFSMITVVAVVIQLVFGAMYRHTGSSHALYSHIAWSFVVMLLVILAGSFCMRAGRTSRAAMPLRLTGTFQHAMVTVQFLLGWIALWQVPPSEQARPIPTADQLASAHQIDTLEAVVTTAHQATGALVLGAVTLGLAWSIRFARNSPASGS